MGCRSILIVEDDEDILEMLKMTLELRGYQVFTATNGQAGLDLLPHMPKPCLILLDLMMPVMDGWSFAEALGHDMILTSIPVVLVTAFSEKAVTLKRARAIIKKPVDLELLFHTVSKFCGPPVHAAQRKSVDI